MEIKDQRVRRKLQQLGIKKRHLFVGTFSRYGIKSGYKGPVETVLLTDIKLASGGFLATHLWFNLTKGFSDLGTLKPGDQVQFAGRVAAYEKGYQGFRNDVDTEITTDYQISRPTKVELVTKSIKINDRSDDESTVWGEVERNN